MKLNWGTSIVLAFVGFIIFILSFVVKTFSNDAYSYNMVSDEYYKEELAFQKTIDASANKSILNDDVQFTITHNQVEIDIPEQQGTTIRGTVHFYRPDNSAIDFELPITETKIIVDRSQLVDGRWNVTLNWFYGTDTQEYYHKEEIYF